MHEIMNATVSHPTVKVIGANGQISLGKQYAGLATEYLGSASEYLSSTLDKLGVQKKAKTEL